MGSYTYSQRGINPVLVLVVVLGIISACSVKKDFYQKETINKTDTTKTIVKVITKDSTHVIKNIVQVDSTTKTRVSIVPVGEFTWDPKNGYKGQATEFHYYQDVNYSKVLNMLDSMMQHSIDSLQNVINGYNSKTDITTDSSTEKGSETPAWAYMLFIVLVAFVVWQILK